MVETFLKNQKESFYIEMIDRLYHIERAFITRRHIKLHYSKQVSPDVASNYLVIVNKYRELFPTIEESLLWFISVEFYSRFLANSKKGLLTLVRQLDDRDVSKELGLIKQNHSEVIGFMKTQRDKYLAHADDVDWKDFPNIFDKEYDALLVDIKSILAVIGRKLNSQRIPTTTSIIEEDVCTLFDDLLAYIAPTEDVSSLSDKYKKDVKVFLNT